MPINSSNDDEAEVADLASVHTHALQEKITKIVRGDGANLHTADGRRIIDAISSWWVVTHGHCHPHIVSAIQEQAGKLNQIIFAGYTHEPAQELAAQLLKLVPDGLEHVFFSDSGSASVEVALKMAVATGTTSANRDDALSRCNIPTTGTQLVRCRSVPEACSTRLTRPCCST